MIEKFDPFFDIEETKQEIKIKSLTKNEKIRNYIGTVIGI